MPAIDCQQCGAYVDTGIGEPEGLSDRQVQAWWDDHAEHWCPFYGEFRRIICHGPKPCEA